MALTEKLTDIADAIRAKTGDTTKLTLTQMVDAIYSIDCDYNLPDYWKSYLATKAVEIKQKVDNASPTTAIFGFFTDAHVTFRNSSGEQVEGNTGHTGEIMRYLTSKAGIRRWIFGGDALSYENSLALCQTDFDKVANWLLPLNRMVVKGNHDLNPYGNPVLTDAQFHSMYFDALVPNHPDVAYYFIDDANTKTRYMIVDTRETSINYSYTSGSAAEKEYVNKEITWIYNTLNSTPNDYQIIVFPHILWWSGGNPSQGNMVLSEAGGDLCILLGEYNKRSSGTQWGQAYNFSSGVGYATMALSGHTHIDYSHTYNTIIGASTTADSYQYANARPDSRIHEKGTITEQALDIFFVDYTNKTAESIRIGCGVDRKFRLGQGQICTITNNLTNCTNSNTATTAIGNYHAVITATNGTFTNGQYLVTCNNFDITRNYCTLSNNGKTLTIDTKNYLMGDIVINATAAAVTTYTITNNLTNCTNSNPATNIEQGNSYSATITANSGYLIDNVTCTMGGVSQPVVNGVISIASVTGNIIINATASVPVSYTNILRTEAQSADNTSIYNNGLGYKNGYYISGANESANSADCLTGFIPYAANSSDVLYFKGVTADLSASHSRIQLYNDTKGYYRGAGTTLVTQNFFTVETLDASTGYYKLTNKGITTGQGNSDCKYVRFSFHQPDGSGIVITRNEPIE